MWLSEQYGLVTNHSISKTWFVLLLTLRSSVKFVNLCADHYCELEVMGEYM